MHVHCLGSAGYHPNESRHTSCYFLPESGIALDAGTGFFRLLDLIEQETLDIMISHAHLDHVLGLTYLLDPAFQKQLRKIRIWGESAKLAAIRENLFHPMLFPANLDAEWNEIDAKDNFKIGAASVSWRSQVHPGGSVAYRLDWENNKRLIYATDTIGDTSVEHAMWSKNADLLIHECYFEDTDMAWAEKTGHSWTSRVAEVAAAAEPKKILLTHVNPSASGENPVDISPIVERLDSEVIIAKDHLTLEF